MKCTNADCGADLPPNAKFCPICGSPQIQLKSKPKGNSGVRTGDIGYVEGNLTDASMRGSASVGNVYFGSQTIDSPTICPMCGARNPILATFRCKQCGQDHLCRTHHDPQHLVCTRCASQVQSSSAGKAGGSEPQFCPSCGGVIADNVFRCVKCERIHCNGCRDGQRRGWCVDCGEAQDRLSSEQARIAAQRVEQAQREGFEGHMAAGQKALKVRNKSEAIASFEAALSLYPDNAAARSGLDSARAMAIGPKQGEGFSNSLGMQFVFIGPGTFMRDSPVTLSRGFHMMTTEVTQGQWRAVMGGNPSFFKSGDNYPVERVSWHDVQEFIKRLNQRDGGNRYRLPTEAEWEYAARAGSTTQYCFGDDESRLGEYAWFTDNSGDSTQPVGAKKPNAWGLYDMHGNVWEWCQDWYGDYPSGSVTDPQGPSSGSYRVLRGGGWYDYAGDCRSANRDRNTPGRRSRNNGFRLVLPQV